MGTKLFTEHVTGRDVTTVITDENGARLSNGGSGFQTYDEANFAILFGHERTEQPGSGTYVLDLTGKAIGARKRLTVTDYDTTVGGFEINSPKIWSGEVEWDGAGIVGPVLMDSAGRVTANTDKINGVTQTGGDLYPAIQAIGSFGTTDRTTLNTINSKIGTPAGTVSTDVAAVQADTANLKTRLPAALVAGRMASETQLFTGAAAADIAAITAAVADVQNNTLTSFVVPPVIVIPTSGTKTYLIRLYIYDVNGNMQVPDSAPVMQLVNSAGTNLIARLNSPTGILDAPGQYHWNYTASPTDTLEQVLWRATVIVSGLTRFVPQTSNVAETTEETFTSTDRDTLNSVSDKIGIPANTTLANDNAEMLAHILQIETYTAAIQAGPSNWSAMSIDTLGRIKLQPTGLDDIDTAIPVGLPVNFRQWAVLQYRRLFMAPQNVKSGLAGTIRDLKDDGSPWLTTDYVIAGNDEVFEKTRVE